MPSRRINHRLIKINRNYTVEELARTLGAHTNTVRGWLRKGLSRIDQRRPTLILGREAIAFLESRYKTRKHQLAAGEIFGVPCRKPQQPKGLMADYLPITAVWGNLRGI